MARFLLYCVDKPDSLALRMANREAHLAYVRDNDPGCRSRFDLRLVVQNDI